MVGPEVHPATTPLPGEPEVFHLNDAAQLAADPGRISGSPAGATNNAGLVDPDVFHPPPAANPDVFHDSAEAADLACLGVRAAIDRLSGVLARTAAAFVRLRAWTVFGFARLDDHARERYGRSGRWVRDLAALGDGIAASRELATALTGADGRRPLGRVAATMVARALPFGPAAEWIAAARRLSVRELREAIHQARGAAAARLSDAPEAGADAGGGSDAEADGDADRCLLRLPVPDPILAAFEETLDLHRAVQGRGTSVTEFIEALVGEAQAGGLDLGEGLLASLRRGLSEALVEAALRRATDAWSTLPAPLSDLQAPAAAEEPQGGHPGPLAGSADPLSRFSALEARAGEGDGIELDAQLHELVRLENRLEAQLGLLLSGMTERRAWARLQFAGAGHYAEERLGLSRTRASERTRLARALRALPLVSAACAEGRISLESASLLHRILGCAGPSGAGCEGSARPGGEGRAGTVGEPVSAAAVPANAQAAAGLEAAWVEHAAAATIKRMRDEARALGRYRILARTSHEGDLPDTSPRGADVRDLDRPMSDEEWCASLRREVGTATLRIQWFGFLAAGISPPADPDVFHADRRDPDVFHARDPDVFHRMLPEPDGCLRLRLPADLASAFLSAIAAARAALEERTAAVPWDEPWPATEDPETRASAWAARIAFVRGRRVPRWVGLLALLEDFAATWDSDGAAPERRDDSVFVRDGWRCTAPGCSSRRNLEVHHVVYRSRGGSDDVWNLVTLCRFHHQCGEHGGLMQVRGCAPTGLVWRLGREDVAVEYRADVLVPRQA